MPLTIWNAFKGQLISNLSYFIMNKMEIEQDLSMAAIRTIVSPKNIQVIEKRNVLRLIDLYGRFD